jgi:hypothetical protein
MNDFPSDKPNPSKYLIQISEAQRLALVQAFMALGHVISLDEECDDLEAMLRALPDDEFLDPGTIHDFTA